MVNHLLETRHPFLRLPSTSMPLWPTRLPFLSLPPYIITSLLPLFARTSKLCIPPSAILRPASGLVPIRYQRGHESSTAANLNGSALGVWGGGQEPVQNRSRLQDCTTFQ